MRVLIGTLILFPILFKKDSSLKQLEGNKFRDLILVSVFGVFGFSFFLVYGMGSVTGVAGSMLMGLTPGLTAFGAYLFLREEMRLKRIAGLIICIAGIMLLAFTGADGGSSSISGVLMVVGAVLCNVCYTLLGKRVTESLSGASLAAWTGFFGTLLFVVPAIIQWDQFELSGISTKGWLSLLWWGAVSMGGGSFFWYKGIRRSEGSVAAGFMGLMPVSGLILSYLVLKEPFHWLHIPGTLAVIMGIILISKTQIK